MDNQRSSPRKKYKEKEPSWPAWFYVLVGLAIFFAVLYFGELILRYRGPSEVPPSPPVSPPEEELGELPPLFPEEEVIIYFTNPDFTALVGEKRKIKKDDKWMEQILEELLKGPRDRSLFNPIPSSTRLNAVFLEGDIVYVDLSAEMAENQSGGTSQELLSVYAIVDTLTAFPEVRRVKILIDGEEVPTLCGHIDISQPLERDERLIAKVQ
ncbi:MAG TPA: GerMN domain-containing protein [Candidatus Atribacteria bacterium]|nr:GerMN domain-containing protein [Candidatus Atribacteria bacterium]HPZ81358.1 GerMN domain-containing protein [Candidatus Atribacteria bacterium]